jgi:uncharacterized protein (TIGR02118 family)
MYPNEPSKKFDMDYFLTKHIPAAKDALKDLGLVRIEVDKGIAGREPETPPPFVAIAHMYFEDMNALQNCMPTMSAEGASDLPNYSDVQPQIQISEIG